MYLVWWYFLFLHFELSCLILVVDHSSIVYSVRLCTVHIGPSHPCQTQAKGTAVHCLKHTQEATSAFINSQHNKCLNVYIFYCYGYINWLPVAPEFYLVYPYHCFSFSYLCAYIIHSCFSLLFWLIPLQLHLLSLSAIQKQLVTIQHEIPKPQFWWHM